jgi:hypothetical protein
VTSISLISSSSQTPSPFKKAFKKEGIPDNIELASSGTMPSLHSKDNLGICPEGWIWHGDRWEDLFSGLRYWWTSKYGDLLSTTCDGIDSLGAAMVVLRFTAETVKLLLLQ